MADIWVKIGSWRHQSHYLNQCWLLISDVRGLHLREIPQPVPKLLVAFMKINFVDARWVLFQYPANMGKGLTSVCAFYDLKRVEILQGKYFYSRFHSLFTNVTGRIRPPDISSSFRAGCMVVPQRHMTNHTDREMRYNTGLILGLPPANERRCYFVTTSLTGWVQAYNQPCDIVNMKELRCRWRHRGLVGLLVVQ